VQEDPEGEAAGAESTVEKSREASAEMKKEMLGFPGPTNHNGSRMSENSNSNQDHNRMREFNNDLENQRKL
jgi:hypothetical protein